MIEKLDSKMEYVEISILGNKKAECLDFEAARKLNKKINELVDAVNELQLVKDVMFNRIDMLNNAICDIRNRITAFDDPTYHEPELADPYAEQRKWIGKLCRFRDKDYKDDQWDYGLLQAVEKAEIAHIWKSGCFKHNLEHWYDCCEPVKQDDDIIYKGGDNE